MTSPPLAIGMPVHNGENFLEATLASILEQTFGDFELVITDNASTDRTEEICRDLARHDRRVEYFRHEHNLGAGRNYRSCYDRTSAPLFKWAAHDDPCAPTLFERSVDALDSNPHAVLAFARVATIDHEGTETRRWRARPDLASSERRVRTRDILARQETFPVFGTVRRTTLERTDLLGDFIDHDRPLLYQLALEGPFVEISEFLFFDREHADRSVRAYDPNDSHRAAVWFDSAAEGRLIFPRWRLLWEHVRALRRSPVPLHRSGPEILDLLRSPVADRARLLDDLVVAGGRAPVIGSAVIGAAHRTSSRQWKRVERRTAEALERLPKDAIVAVIDEYALDRDVLGSVRTHELPADDNGDWAGLPINSDEVITALEQSRQTGTTHVLIADSSRWWLDHYDGFGDHLANISREVTTLNDVTIYRLEPLGGSTVDGSRSATEVRAT